MRSYEDILKFYKTKAGEDLFAEFEDGTDYTATVNTGKTVDADDEGMFSSPAPKKTVQTPVEQPDEEPVFDINEKRAILYLFEVLSENMLDEDER